MLLLGVRIQRGKLPPTASVLRTHAPHGFDGVYSQTYSGSFPVSKLEIGNILVCEVKFFKYIFYAKCASLYKVLLILFLYGFLF